MDDQLVREGMEGRLQPGTEAYERFIDLTARRPAGEMGVSHYRNPEQHQADFAEALRMLQLTADDRYLEIGFGGGQLLEAALRSVRSAAGIDHSPDMVALAGERNAQAIASGRLQLVCGDVGRLPWQDGQFTCAAAVNMFFFVESPEACLRELRRVLEPGGRLVIVTVAQSDDPAAHGSWSTALRAYPAPTMEAMLRFAGFGEVQVREPGSGRQLSRAEA